MKSWKTTVAGIAAMVGALASALVAIFDGNTETSVNTQQIVTAIVGLGLLFARDNDKSSEDVGSKS